MEKFWNFVVRADGGEPAAGTDLYLTEEISRHESWWFETSSRDAFREELNAAQGDLRVWIDSPGGDSFAGAAIHDMLREYSASGKGRVVAMVTLAASAASLVAMAADEIRISMLGTIMIHRPWASLSGYSDELRATADVLDELRNAYIDAYARRTGQSREMIEALIDGSDGGGTYMNANTAIELGFADRLMYEEPDGEDADVVATVAKARIAACIRAAHEFVPRAEGGDPEEPEDTNYELRAALARAALMSAIED